MKPIIRSLFLFCSILVLSFSITPAQAGTKIKSLDEILKMQTTASKKERPKSSSRLMSVTTSATPLAANPASCTIGGGRCSFDSDCCSDNCYAGACQAGGGGCSIEGAHCSFDSDCCSDNCYAGTCQGGTGGCSSGGARCSFDSDCCSGNCYAGECQAACTAQGESCSHDYECCGGSCNRWGRCGDDSPNCR